MKHRCGKTRTIGTAALLAASLMLTVQRAQAETVRVSLDPVLDEAIHLQTVGKVQTVLQSDSALSEKESVVLNDRTESWEFSIVITQDDEGNYWLTPELIRTEFIYNEEPVPGPWDPETAWFRGVRFGFDKTGQLLDVQWPEGGQPESVSDEEVQSFWWDIQAGDMWANFAERSFETDQAWETETRVQVPAGPPGLLDNGPGLRKRWTLIDHVEGPFNNVQFNYEVPTTRVPVSPEALQGFGDWIGEQDPSLAGRKWKGMDVRKSGDVFLDPSRLMGDVQSLDSMSTSFYSDEPEPVVIRIDFQSNRHWTQ